MKEFNFTQSTPDSNWVINHNLDVAETINDINVNTGNGLEKILPLSVVHTSDNSLTIGFSVAFSGTARIIG